jgi:hypothetical protein
VHTSNPIDDPSHRNDMADTDNFPLPADGHDGLGGTIDGTAAGAAGPSTGGVVLSQGAMIAIIIVVVVVALVGSKSNQSMPASSLR